MLRNVKKPYESSFSFRSFAKFLIREKALYSLFLANTGRKSDEDVCSGPKISSFRGKSKKHENLPKEAFYGLFRMTKKFLVQYI